MLKRSRHILAVILLLLFAGEAGLAVAAGFTQCTGRCGCCDQPHAMAASEHAMASVQPPAQRMMGAGDGCCMPNLLSDCDQDQARSIALISQPPRPGQHSSMGMRLNAIAGLADAFTWVGRSAPDPYTATRLSRATTVPIYLQTAVFLC